MDKKYFQKIEIYRYHFMALVYCKEFKNVTAVVESIKATVEPTHSEYEPLLEAGRERWKEIWTKQEAEDKEVKE